MCVEGVSGRGYNTTQRIIFCHTTFVHCTLLTSVLLVGITITYNLLFPSLSYYDFSASLHRVPLHTYSAAPSSVHPHVFPSYFAVMKVSPLDSRKTALKKVVKLLYMTLHQGPLLATLPPITITPPAQAKGQLIPGMTAPGEHVHAGLEPLIAFLQTIRPYLYPSNVTTRTADLGYFLSCLTTELAQHLGQALLRHESFAPLFAQGEASSAAVQGHFHSAGRDSLVLAGSLHAPSARYLAGVLCTISLEGLYAKSPFMVQCCTFSLRSLCAIEPSLGDVIMPVREGRRRPSQTDRQTDRQTPRLPCLSARGNFMLHATMLFDVSL